MVDTSTSVLMISEKALHGLPGLKLTVCPLHVHGLDEMFANDLYKLSFNGLDVLFVNFVLMTYMVCMNCPFLV